MAINPFLKLAMTFETTTQIQPFDWGKQESDKKIAKLPKVIRLKNGQRVYLK